MSGMDPNRKLYPKMPSRPNFIPAKYMPRCIPSGTMATLVTSYLQHSPRKTGVHPINIGPHPAPMGCTLGGIWTPAGAGMNHFTYKFRKYNNQILFEIKASKIHISKMVSLHFVA